jgi:molecular chaperone GrpE (heat shock protein)
VAGGFRIDRDVALIVQTQFASERRRETKRVVNMREDQMPSILNEALEWLDRAEQAREVAGQLTDPSARKAVLALAENFDRLARAAAAPTAARRRELATKDQAGNW